MNIELYIDNRLCDIESPEKLGITLKRVFFNPAELSVKDVQKSYEITLPATTVNNEIFRYANVEETKGKFTIYNDARLYINDVLILDGKFRLSEIGHDYYKGNLGVPAPLTAKDIFGETMMNQVGSWNIDFQGRDGITRYNTGTYDKAKYGDIPPCIFPLVLYGLLPRDPVTDKNPNKEVFDSNVQLTLDHLPPSVNCLQMLKRLFNNVNYKLTGSAFNDERLKNLFVSYQNTDEYKAPWSAPRMKLRGMWDNFHRKNGEIYLENDYYAMIDGNGKNCLNTMTTNLFNSQNIIIDEKEDWDDNIVIKQIGEGKGKRTNVKFTIPQRGLYKIEFDATIMMMNGKEDFITLRIDEGAFDRKFELKLVRNYTQDDFKNERFDNTFYRDNQDQIFGEVNMEDAIFPQSGNVNFIDPKQNKNFISGFSWGYDKRDFMQEYYNPYNTEDIRSNPMAISGGKSWDREETEARAFSAVPSTGYINEKGQTSDFIVEMKNTPAPATGYIVPGNVPQGAIDGGNGHISQIIWLEEGDTLSIIDMSELNHTGRSSNPFYSWPNHSVSFSLTVTPFQKSLDWLTIDEFGSSDNAPGKRKMDWKDTPTMSQTEINLIKFLPSETKVNDWIDNFCKAFNLQLIHKADKRFELNTKANSLISGTTNLIDLDRHTHVDRRSNQSLKLPAAFELGFTVNTAEKGYYDSIKEYVKYEFGDQTEEKVITAGETGGGKFSTGSHETTVVKQTSNFSYNWFKEIRNDENNNILSLPVVTEREIWETGADYHEMQEKRYTGLPQRFWYYSGWFDTHTYKGKQKVSLATLSGEYNGIKKLRLDYHDKPHSIMRNYFLLMTNEKDFTTVGCHLSPEDYARLDTCLVKFNGDLYNIAEADGYDPLGKNRATLKLIRKV